MSDLFRDRHAKLGCMVLRLFPKVMQTILRYYVTPPWLKQKYLKQHFSFVLAENEIVLMDNLPNLDEFTIEICYKILRSENILDEPKCKWGNVPHDTEVEISDDIQRLINATNSIQIIKSEEVTEKYFEKLLEEIRLIATRNDSFLQQDTLESMYNSLCRSKTDSITILQDLTSVKIIDEAEFLPDTESEKRERYSRLSMAVIDTFPIILRGVIRSNISASDLYLRCINYIGYFNPEQQANLQQLQYSNTYSSLDVTLIYRLLRQFQLIPPPTQGWGAMPNKADTKLADDIERIRCYRNQVAHRCDTNIEAKVFDDYFDKFQNIGRRMDLNFFHKTNFEQQIIGHRTSRIDTEMLKKYENAMKEKEMIQLRFEEKPIKFYWGESFQKCLKNLRSLYKDEQSEGRQKISIQIIFQSEDDVERNVHILNSLKDEINEGLHGLEFIVATEGSVVLIVDILMEMLETDETLQTTLALFLEKVLERIMTFTAETINFVLSPVEEYLQWNEAKIIREPVYLEFDIEAQLFETDDIMVEQLAKITDVIFKRSNGSGTNNSITGTILPFYLEEEGAYAHTFEENTTQAEESFIKAQTPIKYNLPVSVTLRKQLNITKSSNEIMAITSCIKTGNTLVFTDNYNKQIVICNPDGTDIHHIPLNYKPWYITEVNINTVVVSCSNDTTILIIDISTRSVTSTINISNICWGISYNDNNLYVVIGRIIHVMDLTGKVIRTIPTPSDILITDITVDRDRLVCQVYRSRSSSIYCCSLEGQLMWQFKNDEYQDLHRVTTDVEGNVYVTNARTHTVIVVSDYGKQHRELLTKSDGLDKPWGIYFDNKENILLICNKRNGKAFLFEVKKNKNKHE